MTLNARFILKCALRTARLTYVRCGFRIQPPCIGIARGGGGEGAKGSNPTLPPRGQLTRCFSAVAELLVVTVNRQETRVMGLFCGKSCMILTSTVLTDPPV